MYCSVKIAMLCQFLAASWRSVNVTLRCKTKQCKTERMFWVLVGVHGEVLRASRLGGGGGGFTWSAAVKFFSRPPLPALAVFWPRGALWWVNSARAIATVTRSWRCHWRSRRSLRRRALPVPPPSASRSTSIARVGSTTNGHQKSNAHLLRAWLLWLLWLFWMTLDEMCISTAALPEKNALAMREDLMASSDIVTN